MYDRTCLRKEEQLSACLDSPAEVQHDKETNVIGNGRKKKLDATSESISIQVVEHCTNQQRDAEMSAKEPADDL